MIAKQIRFITNSLEKTLALGQRIGSFLDTVMVLALIGDLGSGKTVFTKGLAAGLGVPSNYRVTSPTYTLINEYPGKLPLYHADLYRIDSTDELEDIGFFEILYGSGVVAIEWADKLPANTLLEYIRIDFTMRDDDSREILITGHGPEAVRVVSAVETFK
jgi:tRNA threonylcarbamoyladenosine biosynthesis protein TsaE